MSLGSVLVVTMEFESVSWDVQDEEASRGAAFAAFGHDFRLSLGGLPEADITVVAFRLTEAIQALYEAEVLFFLRTEADGDPLVDALGRGARLTLPSEGQDRVVHGVVGDVALVSAHADRRVYVARIMPRLWRLTMVTDTRVFQSMTVPQIVAEVLGAHGIAHTARLSRTHASRRYCLQYGETDFAFVARLLAEEGIAFWFEHPAGADQGESEVLVLADSEAFYQPLSPMDRLTFRPDAGALEGSGGDVLALRLLRRVAPGAVTLRTYDHQRAAPTLWRQVPTPEPASVPTRLGGVLSVAVEARGAAGGPLEDYDPHGHHQELELSASAAATRLAQHRALASTVAGTTVCRQLVPGRTFTVVGHEVLEERERLAVVRVVHHGKSLIGAAFRYRNELLAVPSGVLCRPPYPPRRVVQVVESAVVVGSEGQEIEPDHLGCVRVQFHWDRHGKNDERSSCWIRVLQPWAGPTYGFQFTPRLGMEVLVSFVGGDPDQPVILGCLPNPANAPPYPLPEHATRSGIRTQSSPGSVAGHNELMFEDRQGSETVMLRAQRNHQEVVLNDQHVSVGRDQEETVGQDRSVKVGGVDALRVDGSRRVEVGEVSSTVVGGDEYSSVGGQRFQRVEGGAQLTVGAELGFKVGEGLNLYVGTSMISDATVQTSGALRLVGTEMVRVQSSKGIELTCGSSVVSISPEGITLRAARVRVEAVKEEITLQRGETQLRVGEAMEVESATVRLTTSSAALTLDQSAELLGNPVKLKGPGNAQRSRPDSVEATPGQARFKVDPPPGHVGPLVLVIATPSGEVVERETDGNHEVVLDGVEGDRFELVEVRIPGGDRLQHQPHEA
ncbi:type VI secretion system Vgr family protein [Chondromyces crocatus]|uniref:Uncharacterized protein n=1 Tax=Chondromyces crocatus TaxID=52 RepID=A0A0K1EDB3_CHOCO|nr:type VI secretion system tip protein TssI/VgrG [Chondromyces crocatus]AKT38839.1 uncharacterized protein CMC5_029850 [Chondromyces crocatus]